ncbi:MAG: outer membrane lipoprotein carrier protein LolA [Alysiella sp.]|uniref:LolA family protein n=1 Tax=Alysiella sp. TaxID=1872483 RepID=UPI0026DB30A3|nr:outer membrane lipoprotein carrier protein LolA [Alysiella sp.]MDO4433402.1 outer membrane lipoprotein carrier protein LolA [Alysiella sp.]
MKKHLFSALLCLFSPILWAFSTSELAKTLQKPNHLQGEFTQERHLKSLSKPMLTSGQFVLMPQKGLLWQMQKPFNSILRVRSDGIMQWNGKTWLNPNNGKLSGQSQQIQLFLDLLGGNTQGLEKQFVLQLSGSPQKWTLQLLPKSVLMQQIFKQIDIQGDNVVRRIELHEKQGDRTVMQFKHIQINQTLSEFAQQAL